jgi:hypothetical protein
MNTHLIVIGNIVATQPVDVTGQYRPAWLLRDDRRNLFIGTLMRDATGDFVFHSDKSCTQTGKMLQDIICILDIVNEPVSMPGVVGN